RLRLTRANKPDGYLLGSYRIATAPEPNSSRSRASSRYASIARRTTSVRGPPVWAAPRTRTRQSIPAPPTPAGASPPHEQSLTPLPLQLLNGLPQMIPAHELCVPIDPVQGVRHDVLLCRVDRPGEGFHPIGHPIRPHSRPRRRPPRCLHLIPEEWAQSTPMTTGTSEQSAGASSHDLSGSRKSPFADLRFLNVKIKCLSVFLANQGRTCLLRTRQYDFAPPPLSRR